MTTHNLDGVKQLEKLNVLRVVLSRELSINEIQNICKNTNVEIETFIHGALCICYSGQCLFSSIIGGRSGNRGLCAQPCRLPYTLLDENNTKLNSGHLLSPRDLLAVNYLPELIKSGVACFKIEGRLKSPKYVAIATKFYRKYIDLVCENISKSNDKIRKILFQELNKINQETQMSDIEEITQIFNRGGFSEGHLLDTPNQNLIYKENPSNTGFYLGKVENFNCNKGYVKLTAKHAISLGDTVEINSNTYTVSELMIKNTNIKTANINDNITIGRIKGNIKNNMPIYKLQSKSLINSIKNTFEENKEFKKIPLQAKIEIAKNKPIYFEIWCSDKNSIYYNEKIILTSSQMPTQALNKPITEEAIIKQLSKTGSTEFTFENIQVNLGKNLFIPNLSIINELRRESLEHLENRIIEKHINSRNLIFSKIENKQTTVNLKKPKVSVLLNFLDLSFNYSTLKNIERIYIPLKYFLNPIYLNVLNNICINFNTYIYMPSILRDLNSINFDFLKKFNLKGAVISNISQINFFKNNENFELIGNYTLNIFNSQTIETLKKLNLSSYTLSPELNNEDTKELIKTSTLKTELFVYGKIPLMTINYCLLGNSNHCYKECSKKCNSNEIFYLNDRLNLKFRIVPDNTSTITTIYNSKITSFDYSEFNSDFIRISILDENTSDIQNIINTCLESKRFEGKDYCGHFNK